MVYLLALAASAILVVTPWTLYPYIDGQRLWFRLFVAAAVCVWAPRRLRGEDGPRLRLPDWLALGWLGSLAVSCALAQAPAVAVFSSFERQDGLFQAGCYVAWFLLLRRLPTSRFFRLAKWMVWVGVVACGVPHFVHGRLAGSFGNATFLGAFAVFGMFAAAWVGWGYLAITFLVAAGAAQAKAAALGLAAGCVAYASRRYRLSGAAFVWLVAALVAAGGLTYRTSVVRPYLTRIGIEGVLERPVFGHGPGGFAAVFDRHFPQEFVKEHPDELWFDAAHSWPVDVAVEGGLVGLGLWLALLGVAAWRLRGDPLWFGALVALLTLGLATVPNFALSLAIWTVLGRARGC
jgi:O-antigen ligase